MLTFYGHRGAIRSLETVIQHKTEQTAACVTQLSKCMDKDPKDTQPSLASQKLTKSTTSVNHRDTKQKNMEESSMNIISSGEKQ